MTVSIVACGPSAKEWHKVPCDLSIGVNDCFKFGHNVDYLVVVNAPHKFEPSDKNGNTDRLQIIRESKPKRFFSHDRRWLKYFANAELLTLKPVLGMARKNRVLHSKTSPFIAVSIAFNAGAKDIILWGIDFKDHPDIKGKLMSHELEQYRRLFASLNNQGVHCWVGSKESVLSKYLPVWKP